MNKHTTLAGTLYVLGATLCWSTAGVLIKLIPWNGMTINCIRSILAALLFIAFRKTAKFKLKKMTVIAGLCVFATTVLYSLANKLTTAANAIVLSYTSPIFIVLFQSIVSRKMPRIKDVAVVAVTLFGVSMCVAGNIGGGNLVGDIVAVLAGVTMAGVYLANNAPGGSPMEANYMGFLLGALTFPAIFFDKSVATETTLTAVLAVLALGLVQIGMGYILFSKGIQKISALRASLVSSVEPIASPIWVFLFLHEIPTVYTLIGGAIIVVAVALHNISEARLAEKHGV